jgi:hypothetical protein
MANGIGSRGYSLLIGPLLDILAVIRGAHLYVTRAALKFSMMQRDFQTRLAGGDI